MLIPAQETGGQMDVAQSRTFDLPAEAGSFFQTVKTRMANVNDWHLYTGTGSARFQLMDAEGEEKPGRPEKGDHFYINIPGPGHAESDSGDWVRIEEIVDTAHAEQDAETFSIRVRPCDNPRIPKDDVAHFFTQDATSTFLVHRQADKVTVGIHGRNEKPNVTETTNIIDKLRNLVVGLPAVAGVSHLQWDRLVDGWMNGVV